jgi:hypothetical protein
MQKESARKHHKEISTISPMNINNAASMPLGEVDQLSQVMRNGGEGRKNSQEPLIDRFISHDSDSMLGGLSNQQEKNI